MTRYLQHRLAPLLQTSPPDSRAGSGRRARASRPVVEGIERRTLLSATATALTSSVAAADYGQAVSFTATVTPKGKDTAVPSGTVQLMVDGDPYGPPVVLSNGQAKLSESAFSAGRHRVTATYQPANATFRASDSSPLKLTVSSDATTTSVSSTVNPASYGEATTWTATVANASASGAGMPTGWVQFWVDGGRQGSPVILDGGQASLTSAALSAGAHTIAASYTPADGNFLASTSFQLGETVAPDPTTTAVSLTALDVSSSGTSACFTATVVNASHAGSGVPTGLVQFVVDGDAFGSPVALVEGAASFVDAHWAGGAHTVTAVYTSVDGNFQLSLSSIGSGQMAVEAAAYAVSQGQTPAQITGVLKDVFAWAPNQIASLLEFDLGLSESTITAALDAAGFSWVFNDDGSASSTSVSEDALGNSMVTVVQYDASLAVRGTTITELTSDGSPVEQATYDGAGDLLTATEWNYYGTGRPSSETTVNAAGQTIEADVWYYNADGSLHYSTQTDYNSAGQAIFELTLDSFGRPTVVVQRTYGASGNLIEITQHSSVYSTFGAITATTDDTWRYDASGALQVVNEEDRSFNSRGIEVKATEYEWDYTDQGFLAGGLEIQYSFDAAGGLAGYEVAEFNASGVFTVWITYDASGNVRATGVGKPNVSWDLPAGKVV